MPQEPAVVTLSRLSARSFGVFRAESAIDGGVSRNQLRRLAAQGVIERLLPRTYRMVAVAPSAQQRLRAAMLWAGDQAAAAIARFGRRGRPGVAAMRRLLGELDPVHASRSTLEVKTRRLLVATGIRDFVRELPLEWNGRTYRFDFGFPASRVILETNGRRWHDDASDYEHDNEKSSVPGRHGYRLVLATWEKVTRRPTDFLAELTATLATTDG